MLAALGDHRPDGADAFLGAGDLDHQVGPVGSARAGARAAASVPASVVGQAGGDLDADVAVGAVAVVVQLGEAVERAVDVGEHHRPVVVDDRAVVGGQLAELLVVVGRALDGLLEDRRVAGQAADALVDQAVELARR